MRGIGMGLRRIGVWVVAGALAVAVVPSIVGNTPAVAGVSDEIKVIGGSAVISNEVLDHLASCTDGLVSRLAGANRYATAAAVSAETHSGGASTAFVATGLDFPDAVAAGSPAALNGAPVLLVKSDSVPSATSAELYRLGVSDIKLLGGTSVVGNSVASALGAIAPVDRLAGSNRYATAAEVSKDSFPSADTVYVATGETFPDALSGSVAAAIDDAPVLLTAKNSLPSTTRTEISRLSPSTVVILGGTAAVSSAVESTLKTLAPTVKRIAGANRYGTAAAVSQETFPSGAGTVYIATAENFPDALVGGAAAGFEEAPILLVSRYGVPSETASELARLLGHPCDPFTADCDPANPEFCSPDLTLQTVATGLNAPMMATAPAGDPRLFIAERGGAIKILENGSVKSSPFLTVGGVNTCGEGGLLGMAFHPDFSSNGRFFVHYTGTGGSGFESRVVEYHATPTSDTADATPVDTILTLNQPACNHNAGSIDFGPDGNLYIPFGDGGASAANGQNPDTWLGSVLRINVDGTAPYSIPAGNPYDGTDGAPEVWAIGLRNPFRSSIDQETGDLYIGDVGQGQWEEVSVGAAGVPGINYGWSTTEGPDCYSPSSGCDRTGLTDPVVWYPNTPTSRSVVGGYVYRGTSIPELDGTYFYSDFYSNWIRSFRLESGQATQKREWTASFGPVSSVVGFGQDGFGELYVVSIGGTVHKIVKAP